MFPTGLGVILGKHLLRRAPGDIYVLLGQLLPVFYPFVSEGL